MNFVDIVIAVIVVGLAVWGYSAYKKNKAKKAAGTGGRGGPDHTRPR